MTKQKFIITDAGPEDIRELHQVQLAAYGTESVLYDEPIPPVTQTYEEAAAEFPSWRTFKLVVDGRIAASVRGRMRGSACEVGRLMVLPEYRGRRYATILLQTIEREFPGVPYELYTGDRSLANIAMYQRYGYAIVRTDTEAGLVYFRKNGQTKE